MSNGIMANTRPDLDGYSYRSLRRHHTYYLNGGDLFLLVQQDIFRVHRYFFERDSDYWAKRFQTGSTASPGSEPIGTADNNAIVVQDVTSDELSVFLYVFYNPKYSLYNLTVHEWTIILIVASTWKFREAKAFAVRELQRLTMPDIDRVVLYHDHGVDRSLLLPCYAALADRMEPISLEEGMRLGLETSIMLAKAREIARNGATSPSGMRTEEMEQLVIDLFGVEPKAHAEDPPALNGTSYTASNSGSPPTTPTKSNGFFQRKASSSMAGTPKVFSPSSGSPGSSTHITASQEAAPFGDCSKPTSNPDQELDRPESPSYGSRGQAGRGGRKGAGKK